MLQLVVAVPDDDNCNNANNEGSAVMAGVTDDETFHWCRLLATEAGVMVGANAGMAVAAAARVAAGMEVSLADHNFERNGTIALLA